MSWFRTSLLFVTMVALSAAAPARAESFDQYVEGMWADAWARYVSRETFDKATKGLRYNAKLERLTKKQPEFASPVGGYIAKRVSASRIKTGKRKVKQQRRLLARIEKRTGVDRYIVAAIWGLETAYGGYSGKSDVFRALASLAWKRYRGDFFRKQFIDALVIMEKERVPRSRMIGSWAGGLGQTQFIPSSFLEFAVDFDGDGKRNLWTSVPDALGSTGNYLKVKGWSAGEPWGYPVKLSAGAPRIADTRSWAAWRKAGVARLDGGRFPGKGQATLFFPAGAEGQAFLVTGNFEVIKSYNYSDAYAISVALIAEHLRGNNPPALDWPTDAPLTKSRRMEVQKRLVAKGIAVDNRVGKITPAMRATIRDYQRSIGLRVADGHPDAGLLKQLAR